MSNFKHCSSRATKQFTHTLAIFPYSRTASLVINVQRSCWLSAQRIPFNRSFSALCQALLSLEQTHKTTSVDKLRYIY